MPVKEQQKTLFKRILRPLAPKRLLAEREVFLRLGPQAGRIYLKLRILDAMKIGASNRGRVPQGVRSFLFVCYGNIMRSPVAELMLTRALGERGINGVTVKSAGIHAKPGSEAHPRAQVAARELGLPLDQHRSQLLREPMVEEADAIFAMDFQNKAELLAIYPQAQRKIFMLGVYNDLAKRTCQIPDPFFGDQEETRRCYHVLQTCIDGLVASLWSEHVNQTAEVRRSDVASTQL